VRAGRIESEWRAEPEPSVRIPIGKAATPGTLFLFGKTLGIAVPTPNQPPSLEVLDPQAT
jgi:hypothetical protein